jgi:hypothetical protein
MKKLFLTTLMAVSAAFGYSQTPYWSYGFDDGALTDAIGNDDLAASTNGFTSIPDRFSNADDAISLDGDSLTGGVTSANDFSISFWIKDAPNDAQLRALVHQFSDFGYSIRLQNGVIKAVSRMAYSFNNQPLIPYWNGTSTITGTTDLSDGDWHHVVFTANHYQVQFQYKYDYALYVDGALEGTDTKQVDMISGSNRYHVGLNSTQTFYVGCHQTGGLVRYDDKIDDISFYKSVLSTAQINEIYNARPAAVVYVDEDATGANDGSSWADAFTDLAAAMDYADVIGDELWVAEGTYKPSVSARSEYFSLNAGVAVYGGFNGTETQLSQRDWRTYETILSGDLNGNDNANVSYTEATRSENSYRVLFV